MQNLNEITNSKKPKHLYKLKKHLDGNFGAEKEDMSRGGG
jgi:hypothetical protein